MLLQRLRLSGALLFSLGAAALSHAAKIDLTRETPVPATEQIPVADFFRPALLSQPSLNPSGTHVAAIATHGGERHQLVVHELNSQRLESVQFSGDRDIYHFTWLNDKRLLFQLSARKMYGVALMATEVGSLTNVYPILQYYGSHVVAVPPDRRLRPLVWNRFDGTDSGVQHDLGVAVVNTDIATGRVIDLLSVNASMEQLMNVRADNDRHIVERFPAAPGLTVLSYIADPTGQLDFCITADAVRHLYRFADNRWQLCPVDLEEIDVIGTGNTRGELVVMGPRQEGKPRALQFMEGATGKLGDVLIQDSGYDFYASGLSEGWLHRDPVKHQIIGAEFHRTGPHVVWFTDEYKALQKILEGYFPKQVVRIIDSDEAQKIFLVATWSDRQPVVYQWVNLEKRAAGLFKRSAPWIDPTRMQAMNPIKFKTRDGLKLDAYLTLPAGASKTNLPPLVVLSHGGPWARDSWGYDSEVQFLASRGYAVLQTNYRGSNGYGWMYPKSDDWDFAKMHDDVTDATKAMIASGLVDPNRIAIMGGSFGGYLALSGVVNEPAMYRCAVTIAGVFDWAQQLNDKKYDQYESFVFGYLMHRLGDPKKEPEKFDAISPGRHVEKIRVPVFVAGGKDDQTVEIQQSRNLISALKSKRVPYESYIVADEGHGMAHLNKQVELYTRIEAFLGKYLAPKTAVAAASP